MRPNAARTPLPRAPFGDRRNLPSKAEFTPLLKSAARNNHRLNGDVKRNARPVKTPAGFRAPLVTDSPALPFNSSVLINDDTASDQHDVDGPSIVPPMTSSSPVSTPIAPPRRGEGPLDARGNLATLREQEAVRDISITENQSMLMRAAAPRTDR